MSKCKGTPKKCKSWKKAYMAPRRKAAEERQVIYDKLTTKQKLQKLDRLNLRASKERTKLRKQLELEGRG